MHIPFLLLFGNGMGYLRLNIAGKNRRIMNELSEF